MRCARADSSPNGLHNNTAALRGRNRCGRCSAPSSCCFAPKYSMLTPDNANQFTIPLSMTATDGWQGRRATESIVRDEVLTLGPERQLVGIVSHPPMQQSLARATTIPLGRSDPGVIILNAGVLHRVGPHRLHVVL